MPRLTAELKELAYINLNFALAEIEHGDDSEAITRALDHIVKAAACLKIIAPETSEPDDANEEAA